MKCYHLQLSQKKKKIGGRNKCEEAIKDDRKFMLNGVGIATGSVMEIPSWQEVVGYGPWRSSLGFTSCCHFCFQVHA